MKPGKGFNCVPFDIMGTIRLPDNLDLLIQQLPQQRYSESQVSQVSQISVKKIEKKAKDQDQDHENVNMNLVNIIKKTEPIEKKDKVDTTHTQGSPRRIPSLKMPLKSSKRKLVSDRSGQKPRTSRIPLNKSPSKNMNVCYIGKYKSARQIRTTPDKVLRRKREIKRDSSRSSSLIPNSEQSKYQKSGRGSVGPKKSLRTVRKGVSIKKFGSSKKPSAQVSVKKKRVPKRQMSQRNIRRGVSEKKISRKKSAGRFIVPKKAKAPPLMRMTPGKLFKEAAKPIPRQRSSKCLTTRPKAVYLRPSKKIPPTIKGSGKKANIETPRNFNSERPPLLKQRPKATPKKQWPDQSEKNYKSYQVSNEKEAVNLTSPLKQSPQIHAPTPGTNNRKTSIELSLDDLETNIKPFNSEINALPRTPRGSSRPQIDMETEEGKRQYRELLRRREIQMGQKRRELSRIRGYREKVMAGKRRMLMQGNKNKNRSRSLRGR